MQAHSDNMLDKTIGSSICRQRMRVGMTQTAHGETVGVTFQQIQKYENATNRISASRLFELSKILPSIKTYSDALSALVPTEMLTVHALVIAMTTKKSDPASGAKDVVSVVIDSSILA